MAALALAAVFPVIGGVEDDGLGFRGRIDCNVKSEHEMSRLSFLFPDPDVQVDGKFAVLQLQTYQNGWSSVLWRTADDVLPRAAQESNDLPPPPVYYPIIHLNGSSGFEYLAPKGGKRWSYTNDVISSHGDAYLHRGKCVMINEVDAR